MAAMGRPTKERPRNEPMSFRVTREDTDFVGQVSDSEGLTKSTAAYRIFECGKRLYFAECSQVIANDDANQTEGGAS